MPLIQDNFGSMYEKKDYLMALLDKLQIKAKVIQDEKFTLIYKSEVPLLPVAMRSPIPTSIPELTQTELYCERGFLYLGFNVNRLPQEMGFGVFAEIPGYSKVNRGLALKQLNPRIRIPFPNESSFKVNYGLIYRGIKLPASIKSIVYCPKPSEFFQAKKKIVFLSGMGSKVQAFEKELRLCEKIVRLQINQVPRTANKIHIALFSPFNFSDPFWYGRYNQNVRVEIDSKFAIEQNLLFGENVLEIDLSPFRPNKRSYIIELKFKFHAPVYKHSRWCTAAYLDYAKLEK